MAKPNHAFAYIQTSYYLTNLPRQIVPTYYVYENCSFVGTNVKHSKATTIIVPTDDDQYKSDTRLTPND